MQAGAGDLRHDRGILGLVPVGDDQRHGLDPEPVGLGLAQLHPVRQPLAPSALAAVGICT